MFVKNRINMLENYDLKPYKEVLEEYGLTPEDETGEVSTVKMEKYS